MNALGTKLDDDTSVFEWLSDEGYATGLFTDNTYLTDLDTGLSNGFDVVLNDKDPFPSGISPAAFAEEEGTDRVAFLRAAIESDAPVPSLLNGATWMLKWHVPQLTAGAVFTRGFTYAEHFAEWRETTDGPWAACVNLMDTHVPFRPDDEYDEWASDDTRSARKSVAEDDVGEGEEWKYALQQNRYDGTIRQADAVIERIVDSLRSAGELNETLVVITADHGEGFGERTPVTGDLATGHGDGTSESLLHVPLVVRAPGQHDGTVIENPVGLVDFPDVVRTVVDGGSPDFDTDRTVFAGGLTDGDAVDVAYERHESVGVSKYVRIGDNAWTVHAPDPRVNYLHDEGAPTSVVEEMASLSDAGVARDADVAVSEAAHQQLEALGYTK
ncbi:hypothetical protein GCM10009037_01680 [Halarchaeum grantii]|uniref:Sulfatase N-terminal domain-containing protein n=1 Tax=Halarchaeum grantii TaxID=1193105 RepID=A0A830ET00_9EURY|nr:hypothetical protein GCM10009037_01680 [Halarchaeum grantii]